MRKLSMHRSGKGGGPKKVAPPSLPGHEVPQYYVPGYTLPVADTADFHSLDQSYDSTHSEGKVQYYSTYSEDKVQYYSTHIVKIKYNTIVRIVKVKYNSIVHTYVKLIIIL